MNGFGFSGEMIFLFFLALILFGPKKLPEIGRQIGRIMNEFRRASYEFRSQIESEINAAGLKTPQILPPGKAPLGSLASRIFNPPAQTVDAPKTAGAEADSPAAPVAELPGPAAENGAAAKTDSASSSPTSLASSSASSSSSFPENREPASATKDMTNV